MRSTNLKFQICYVASEDDKYSYFVFDKEGNLILSQNEEEQAQIEKIK